MAAKTIKKKKEEVLPVGNLVSFQDRVSIWYDENKRYVFAALAVIVVLGLGNWAYRAYAESNERAARDAYAIVAAKLPSGEDAGPQSWEAVLPDLKQMVESHRGTKAALTASTLLSRAYMETGKPEAAIDLLVRALDDASGDAALEGLIRYQLATAYSLAKKDDAALAEWAKLALQTGGPVAREANWRLARLYSARGDHARALEYLEKASAVQGPLPNEVVLFREISLEKGMTANTSGGEQEQKG